MKQSGTIPITPDRPITPCEYNEALAASQDNSTLVKRTINEDAQIRLYANCIEFRAKSQPPRIWNKKHFKRSTIKTFSKRSRFRLFQLMAKVAQTQNNNPLFVSLTYHYGHEKREIHDKTVLHNFLVSLRDYDKDVQYIWRIDLQKRGAPHYHLIIFPHIHKKICNRSNYLLQVARIWHRVADPSSKKHKDFGCDVQNIKDYRQACNYVNKYLAKLPEGEKEIVLGKHWGCSRNVPVRTYKIIELDDWSAGVIIYKLRRWLLSKGKDKYADPEYFNEDRNQVVFISLIEVCETLGIDMDTICSLKHYMEHDIPFDCCDSYIGYRNCDNVIS